MNLDGPVTVVIKAFFSKRGQIGAAKLLCTIVLFFAMTLPLYAGAVELQPSFPNHALSLVPLDGPRAAARSADEDIPFTWDQTAVVYEGSSAEKIYRGFDPEFQPIQVDILDTVGAPMPIAIASASQAKAVVTIDTGIAHGYQKGQSVAIAGVPVDGYNGTFVITGVPTTTTFTYNAKAGLAATFGGTATAVLLTVTGFDGNFGVQDVSIKGKTGGNMETFQFRIIARNIPSDPANFIYDIRSVNSRVRLEPVLTRSAGAFIKPGQIVRYSWTPTSSSERFPKCEAALTGRTGTAKGLESSKITQVLAIRVQPKVLGHYLMLVTPRDVSGQPPLGSTSNGQVFQCAFGSANLPPVADGFFADTFTPVVNQTVTLQPNLTDPETGQTTFTNQTYEFGDGTTAAGVDGATTHSYALPGIYRVRCTAADDQGATTTAEDSIIVGATAVGSLAMTYVKEIVPEEAGIGLNQADLLSVTFRDLPGAMVNKGDRIIFTYNRNHFGRVSSSDNADDTDIVLGPGKVFTGKTRVANNISVSAGGGVISIKINNAQFDRTGDPRLGRSELKGIFKNQRIALCIIPADNSTPRVLLYTGNMQGAVKGGQSARGFYIPEEHITGMATTKEPNPKTQEP